MAQAVVRAAQEATSGSLRWADVLVGTAGVLTLAVVGFCAGALLRRWLFAPLVGLVVFLALAAPNPPSLRPLGLLLPVRQVATTPRFETTGTTTVFTMVAMVSICVAAACWVTWRRRRRAAYQSSGDALAWVGAVLVLGVVAFVWRPEFYAVDRPVATTCRDVAQIELCLHTANLPTLPAVSQAVEEVRGAGLGPAVTRVTDFAVADVTTPGAGEVFLYLDPGPFGERMALQNVHDLALEAISAGATIDRCAPDTDIAVSDASRALYVRILVLAGYRQIADVMGSGDLGPASELFGSMDAAELSAWVAQHRRAIATCTIDSALDLG